MEYRILDDSGTGNLLEGLTITYDVSLRFVDFVYGDDHWYWNITKTIIHHFRQNIHTENTSLFYFLFMD